MRRKTAINEFYPVFTEVQVSKRKSGGQTETALIVSVDWFTANKKFAYMVGFVTGGTQDAMGGSVIFPTVGAIANRSILNYKEPTSYLHSQSYPDKAE